VHIILLSFNIPLSLVTLKVVKEYARTEVLLDGPECEDIAQSTHPAATVEKTEKEKTYYEEAKVETANIYIAKKKPVVIFILILVLAISIGINIFFSITINNKDKDVLMYKDQFEKADSIKKDEMKWTWHFPEMLAKTNLKSSMVTIGDSAVGHVFLQANYIKLIGNDFGYPVIILGKDVDTLSFECIDPYDTIRPESWTAEIRKKATRPGRDSIVGVYQFPDPNSRSISRLSFKTYFTVVGR
jgi:hypothetical protein